MFFLQCQLKILNARGPKKSIMHKMPSAKTKAKATNSKSGMETGVVKERRYQRRKKTKTADQSNAKQVLKATGESDSGKKTKITDESNAKHELKATEESSFEKELKVTVDVPKVRKEMDDQEMTLSRRCSKNVRTCVTCGLLEPAPKVFKKCKR